MLFPETPHIKFQRNTLIGATCQFMFPPILRITQGIPAEFQEEIRDRYPLFGTQAGITISQGGNQPPMQTIANSYLFTSAEVPTAKRTVILSQNSMALTTTDYTQRSEFFATLQQPLDALKNVYKPPFFIRVGMRYQNLVSRQSLGLENISWAELIRPEVLGIVAKTELIDKMSVDYTQNQFQSDFGKINFQHGLTINPETQELCYLLDLDVYTDERVELDNAFTCLQALNRDAFRIYYWCLTDTLKAAMEPTALT